MYTYSVYVFMYVYLLCVNSYVCNNYVYVYIIPLCMYLRSNIIICIYNYIYIYIIIYFIVFMYVHVYMYVSWASPSKPNDCYN